MHLLYSTYFIYIIFNLILLICCNKQITYLDVIPGVKKFKIYIFQSLKGVKHTGIILEHRYSQHGQSIYLTKFDFGYGNKFAFSSIIPDRFTVKHSDLVIQPLLNYKSIQQYEDDHFKDIYIAYELGYYWIYPFNRDLPLEIMKDSTKYSLFANNCRCYIIKLITRLSKGRNQHHWETEIINNLKNIQHKALTLSCLQYNCVSSNIVIK